MQHDPFYERTDAADRETERLRTSHDGRDSESAERTRNERQPLRRLQRTRGNQAVQRAMGRADGADREPDIRLGDPNSAAEREAERRDISLGAVVEGWMEDSHKWERFDEEVRP